MFFLYCLVYVKLDTISKRQKARMCHPGYGKEVSQNLIMFPLCVWWGEEEKSACFCHSEEWAVFVMMLKYTWGNGEMLWAEALVGVCIRETRFCVTSVRGIQACEMLIRYLTYPRTLPFDQTDLPPIWHLEAEIYIRKMGFLWRISADSRKETPHASVTQMCGIEHSCGSAGLWCAQGGKWGEVTPQ